LALAREVQVGRVLYDQQKLVALAVLQGHLAVALLDINRLLS